MARNPASRPPDGGPAFPRTGVGNAGVSYDVEPQDGMTLRDWMAGQALAVFSMSEKNVDELQAGVRPDYELVAKFCYLQADAMLKARAAGTGEQP